MRKTKKEQKKEGEVTVQTTAFSRFYIFIKSIFLLHSLQKTPDLSGAECKGVVRHRSTPTSVVKP